MQLLHLNTIQILFNGKRNSNRWSYTNKVYKGLNALDFGVPQSRSRTFMLSIRNKDIEPEEISNLNYNIQSNLGDYLRFNHKEEIIEATPNYTPSRIKFIIKTDSLQKWSS